MRLHSMLDRESGDAAMTLVLVSSLLSCATVLAFGGGRGIRMDLSLRPRFPPRATSASARAAMVTSHGLTSRNFARVDGHSVGMVWSISSESRETFHSRPLDLSLATVVCAAFAILGCASVFSRYRNIR